MGEQTEPAPWNVLVLEGQPAAAASEHAPVAFTQQAPCGQGLGEQTEPAPLNEPMSAGQPEAVDRVQLPVVELQQAPWWQGAGMHDVLLPW